MINLQSRYTFLLISTLSTAVKKIRVTVCLHLILKPLWASRKCIVLVPLNMGPVNNNLLHANNILCVGGKDVDFNTDVDSPYIFTSDNKPSRKSSRQKIVDGT